VQGSGPRVSGAMLIGHRLAMEDLAGADVVSRALASLGPERENDYRTMTALSWLPVELADAVTTAVAREAGRPLMEFHGEVTRLNLQRTFTTLWRLLLRVTTDSALMSRTPSVYARTFDQGTLVSQVVAPGRAEVKVRGWADMPPLQLEGLRVGVDTVLVVAGRRDVKVFGERHAQGANFTASWRA